MKRLASILIACTIMEALQQVRPGAQWVMGATYADLVWLDKIQTKPTLVEVTQAIADCTNIELSKKAEKEKAILDAKDPAKSTKDRLDALIRALGL